MLSQVDGERQGRVFQAQGTAKTKRRMRGKDTGGHRKFLAQLVGGVGGRALRARKAWDQVKAWVRRQGVATDVDAAQPPQELPKDKADLV